MWAKPWGKRLHWGDAHWALLYHLLRIYVTGAWLTCKLLHSYRPQTAALRCYEKTQIYVKRLTCMANFNPSIITETGIKYGISPQHLCRWRLGSQELWVWTHNFAGSKKNKRLLILKFGIWEMCLYFQPEGLKIAHLPQISLGWLTVFKRRCKFQISPNQIHLSRLQVQSSCRIIITTWDQFFQWHPDQMEANESRWEVKWWELKIHDHKVSEQGQTFLRHCWPTEDEGTEPDWCFSSSFMMEN